MDSDALGATILNYLERHNAMSLATVEGDLPHAASVFYVSRGYDLFFISSPDSRHGRNLMTSSHVSATINEDYANWGDIKGLQLKGQVEQIGSLADNNEIADEFTAKFSDVSDFFKSPDELPEALADKVRKVRFYKFRPSKIFYIDNSLSFGHRQEMEIS
jgi:hypothetical protein